MSKEVDMPRPFKRFVLPYESEYTAHRDDERTSQVTRLRLKAREYVRGPAIMPDLADMALMDLEQRRKHTRSES
jgi:hypothetical protein